MWMTIPKWNDLPRINLLGREQDALPKPDGNTPQNVHVFVRGRLSLPNGECKLLITADDHYQLFIDGVYQGQGPAPSSPARNYCDAYSVSGGTHVIALHLYYQGLCNRVWNSGDGKLGVWLSVQCNGREVGCCDERWKWSLCEAYSGGVIGYDTQFLEDFNSNLYPEGWELPDYPDYDWGNLVPAVWKTGPLEPRPVRMLEEYAISPTSVTPIPGGLLLDFGREITGNLALTAMGRKNDRVEIRCAEELEQGRARFSMRCNCSYREIWTLSGREDILHQYDYKAFRYVELLCPESVTLNRIAAHVRHYPMENDCTLRCPEGQMEDIFEICKNAVRCCTQEGFLDCPSREKGQYLGDAIVTARSQIWLTGSTEMLRKAIRDFLDYQTISPGLMAVAPGSLMQEIADFSLLFPMLPLMDYEFTGDEAYLMECYGAVKTMTAAFGKYQRPDGLLETVSEQWNLVDWPENLRDGYDFPLTRPIVAPGCHNVVNALWYGANRMQERMEEILGLSCTGRSAEIGAAFQKAFYRPEQRLFADSTQSGHCSLHANIYPAFFGLLPEGFAGSYVNLLTMPDRVCGAVPMYFALRSLGKLGRQDMLWQLMTRSDQYGWRNMLREGATAAMEAWGKEQKWNTSLCHAWNSGLISLFIEEIAGFHPDPGAAQGFRFAPASLPVDYTLTIPFKGKQYRIEKGTLSCCTPK